MGIRDLTATASNMFERKQFMRALKRRGYAYLAITHRRDSLARTYACRDGYAVDMPRQQ